jgi:hypothetical protein
VRGRKKEKLMLNIQLIFIVLPLIVVSIRFYNIPFNRLIKKNHKMGGASSVITPEKASVLSPESQELLQNFEKECTLQNMTPIDLAYAMLAKHQELSKIDGGNITTERKNVAFIFIKPHANNAATQEKVSSTLIERGLRIVKEGEFTGEVIDRDMLIGEFLFLLFILLD